MKRKLVVYWFQLVLLISFLISSCGPKTTGFLAGKVIVGPLSPVERVGVPTSIPPAEVFTSRGINIYRENSSLANSLFFNPDGTFFIELPTGIYRVKLIPIGIDRTSELPATISIKENQTTILDLDIDTGIR